ncbi:hypothetical protein DFH08DRAFT_968270 [Mycena albidolilacea]|uniref:Uncharacterized protein n=1 Tax=Mycena albidolilacea TaxID=1033008 RepID=A0AAD7EJE6_9AGAR|nr:hypothetical protein DFH08DRAFT_968270 [Mycena albidolilacea]
MSSTVSLCLRAPPSSSTPSFIWPPSWAFPNPRLDARVSEACLKRGILLAAKGARERDRLVQEFDLREVGRTRTDRRALRELRHQATPPSHLAPLSSLRLLPRSPAALVPLIPPTPPFVSPPFSVETPHDSGRWSLTPSARAKPHQATSAHFSLPPSLAIVPAHTTTSRSMPPPVDSATLSPPRTQAGRQFGLSDAQVNGRRALTDRRSPDGYATPGPPSRPPRRPAVFSAPPLHLLAEKTTTTDSAHPTTITNSTTGESRREDQEPADLGTLSSVARRDALPGSGRAFDSSIVVVLSVRLPRRPFLGATFAPRLHGPHARPHPDTPLEPHAGKAPRPQAPTPTTHSRPQRTHAHNALTPTTHPRPHGNDAHLPPSPRPPSDATPRQVRLRSVVRYYLT